MTRILVIAAGLLLVIDWAQTLRISREPGCFREVWNVVLPAHPSIAAVHTWFASVALLAGVAAWLLPDLRLAVGLLGGALEGACVVNNFRKGIRP